MDMTIGASEFVKAVSVMTGVSVVALPGVQQVIAADANIEALYRKQEAELGRLLRFFSPEPKQMAALHELGVEVLPIRLRPFRTKRRVCKVRIPKQKDGRHSWPQQ